MKGLIIFSLIISSFSVNAAFYLKTSDGNKVTISKDFSMVVYINTKNESERFLKDFVLNDQIDNYGRPYNSVSYANSKCLKIKKCEGKSLGIKVYSDKIGGANIIFFDSKGSVIKTEDVADNDISQD